MARVVNLKPHYHKVTTIPLSEQSTTERSSDVQSVRTFIAYILNTRFIEPYFRFSLFTLDDLHF